MNRIGKAIVVVFALAVCTLLTAPAAYACCTPCQGYCQPGVPPTAWCCTGIPEPGNACGLTTCGKWWQRQRSDEASALNAVSSMTPAEAPAPGCEQAFPWLATAPGLTLPEP